MPDVAMNGIGSVGAISLEAPSTPLDDEQRQPPWDFTDDGEPAWREYAGCLLVEFP